MPDDQHGPVGPLYFAGGALEVRDGLESDDEAAVVTAELDGARPEKEVRALERLVGDAATDAGPLFDRRLGPVDDGS